MKKSHLRFCSKKKSLLILTIFLLFVFNGCIKKSDRYYNKEAGYSVKFPVRWRKAKTPVEDIVVYVSPAVGGHIWDVQVAIGVMKMEKEVNLEKYSNYIIAEQKRIYGNRLIVKDYTTIGNEVTIVVLFDRVLYNMTEVKLVYLVTKEYKIYHITFDTTFDKYDKYIGVFQEIIDSFRFKNHE